MMQRPERVWGWGFFALYLASDRYLREMPYPHCYTVVGPIDLLGRGAWATPHRWMQRPLRLLFLLGRKVRRAYWRPFIWAYRYGVFCLPEFDVVHPFDEWYWLVKTFSLRPSTRKKRLEKFRWGAAP